MQLSVGANLSTSLQLSQRLTPQVIQLFHVFNLSFPDLVSYAESEALDNIFLHYEKPMGTGNLDHHTFDYHEFITLHSFLLSQIDTLYLSDRDRSILIDLIDSVDDRGYIIDYTTLSASLSDKYHVQKRKIHDVLTTLQSLEPDGVGSRSLQECLLLQINSYAFESDDFKLLLHTLIRDYLSILGDKQYVSIAEALDVDVSQIEILASFIKNNLTPSPGSLYASDRRDLNYHIIPSFDVSVDDNGVLSIDIHEKETAFNVQLSGDHERYLEDPHLDDESRQFLMAKFERAKLFIEHVRQRQDVLRRLIYYLADIQYDFFCLGLPYLQPLLQKELTEVLDLSASTISRLLSSKYVRTPHGVFLLNRLCPRRTFGKTSVQMKALITDIIEKHPLWSDGDIHRYLLKERGIKIARRTVNAYRHAL